MCNRRILYIPTRFQIVHDPVFYIICLCKVYKQAVYHFLFVHVVDNRCT